MKSVCSSLNPSVVLWPNGGEIPNHQTRTFLLVGPQMCRCCEALLCGTCFSLAFAGYSSHKEGDTAIEFAQSMPAPIPPTILRL